MKISHFRGKPNKFWEKLGTAALIEPSFTIHILQLKEKLYLHCVLAKRGRLPRGGKELAKYSESLHGGG